MRKSGIALILSICLTINSISMPAFAAEKPIIEPDDNTEYIDIGAYTIGNNVTVNHLLEQSKFTASSGHGFAAERGNNLIDWFKGQNTVVVGDNNVKNGPDRLIIGRNGSKIWIQDKYYNTANGSINACFDDNGIFRYVDADGNAMQIEVPRDQYEAAVEQMREKIRNGQLKSVGISDPDDAENLVRKGSLSYKQAVNLAKAGTIESLTYDAVNGTVSAGCAFGISSLIVYSVSRLNGNSPQKALKTSAIQGLKAGGVAFGTSVISSQLARTNIMEVFTPSSEALVKALGDDFAEALLQSAGKGATKATVKQAAKILRNQALTAGVTCVLLPNQRRQHTMYDYMQALQEKFFSDDLYAKQRQEIETIRCKLSHTLDKQQRKQLLQLVDAESQLRDDMALDSFIAGFRLACGICSELGRSNWHSYVENEEQRLSEEFDERRDP